MNSCTIERYGAGIGDDLDAKMKELEYIKNEMVLMNSWKQHGASVGDDFDAKMN